MVAEFGLCTMKTGGIGKDQLGIADITDTGNTGACRLGLRADGGNFFANDCIQKGRLAGIGMTCDGSKEDFCVIGLVEDEITSHGSSLLLWGDIACISCEAELFEDGFFLLAHFALVKRRGFVVVAQQVEHRVYGEERDFTLQDMTIHFGLFDSHFHGDHDITEDNKTGFRVGFELVPFGKREGEDICFGIFIAVDIIEFTDFLIVNKRNADFGIMAEAFGGEDCLAAAANQKTYPDRNFDLMLVVLDINL